MPTTEDIIRAHITHNMLFTTTYPYDDHASFLEEGIIDSMNVMQLILFVEEHFGLRVPDQDITPDNFDSVSKIAAYVRQRQAEAAPAGAVVESA